MKLTFWKWAESGFAMARTKACGSIHFRGLNVYFASWLQELYIIQAKRNKKGKYNVNN